MFPLKLGFFVSLFVIAIGSGGVYFIDQQISTGEMEKRQERLERAALEATADFRNGIERFASLVGGLSSFIDQSPAFPRAEALQQYVRHQQALLEVSDSLVVSFLNKDHIFQFSFTPASLSPNELRGTSVAHIRDAAEIKRLDDLMKSDSMCLFPPMNLVEGWVGIPLNFRVKDKGEVIGYIAPIINFASIIDRVYQGGKREAFVYRFSSEGVAFDRAAVYDGSSIHHNDIDRESVVQLENPPTEFVSNSFKAYGRKFNIEVANKFPYQSGLYRSAFLYSWFLILVVGLLLFYFFWRAQAKRSQLLASNNRTLNELNRGLKTFAVDVNKIFKGISVAASHDLKEPLRTIGSYSHLVKKRYGEVLDDEGHVYLGFIDDGVSRMQKLIKGLVSYTEVCTYKSLSIKPVDLNILLGEAELELDEQLLSIETVPLPTLQVDRRLIRVLFQHMLQNAIQFNQSKRVHVKVEYQSRPNGHLLHFRDNGIGFSTEYAEQIFEPFKRLADYSQVGSGIGLSICRKIMELHHGRIWATSTKERGSTFHLYFPK